jgi:MFS family permease
MKLPDVGILRERQFRSLYFARTFSMLGDGIVPVALAFAVLEVERSATALGLVLGAQALTRVGFILVGGVVGDRLPRRLVMVTSDMVRFATQAATAALLISQHAELWHLVALQATHGAASAFFLPASTGIIPELVRRDRLQEANALVSLTSSAFSLLGPVASGTIVATSGPGWAFAVDSGTFLLSASFLLRIGSLGVITATTDSFLAQFRAGWYEVRSRTWLWMDGLFSALGNAITLAPIWVLGPLIAKESLSGARSWAAITALFGAGAIVGSIGALRFKPERPLFVAWSLLALFALPPAMLAIPAPTAIIAASAFLAGISLNFANTLFETVLQQEVPSSAISRATSFTWGLALVLQPIGFAAVGPIADAVGMRATLIGAGAWELVACAIVLSVPGVRDLRRVRDVELDPDAPVDAVV